MSKVAELVPVKSTKGPRRRLTVKDRLAELDEKIARAEASARKLRDRRGYMVAQIHAKAKADLAEVEAHMPKPVAVSE